MAFPAHERLGDAGEKSLKFLTRFQRQAGGDVPHMQMCDHILDGPALEEGDRRENFFIRVGERRSLHCRMGTASWTAVSAASASRRDPNGVGEKATIEPLDAGEMDNFAVLAHLQRIHFGGLIGFQGYSIGGDPYPNLKRSLAAFRDMERRLEAHPSWAPAS